MTTGEDFAVFVNKLDVPVLDLKGAAGRTDYIDFIDPKNVAHRLMKGIDKYSRPFLVVKAIGNLETGEEMELFQTFFQRYSDNEFLWMGCGNYGNELFDTCGGMRESHFKALLDLINGNSISYNGFFRNDGFKIAEIRLSGEVAPKI